MPLTIALPAAFGVNRTEQLPDERMHVVELNVPPGPVSANVTVPVGVSGPIVDVSVAVAEHVDA